MSTDDARSARARPTSSPACWPRGAAPGSGSRAACRSRRPSRAGARSRRGASASRVSSSATSMRIAKAVASVSARSCAASARHRAAAPAPMRLLPALEEALPLLLAPAAAPAARPASASSRSCSRRSSSIVARRAPSRSRAASQAVERLRAPASSSGAPVGRSAGVAAAAQPQRPRPRESARRVGQPGAHGVLQRAEPLQHARAAAAASRRRRSRWVSTRTSTLPRLSACVSSSRSAGSCGRSSSGRRKREVEEAAVDRADFDARAAPRAPPSAAALRCRRGLRPAAGCCAAGVAGHAVNCHERFRVRCGTSRSGSARPQHLKLCQRSNPHRCRRTP